MKKVITLFPKLYKFSEIKKPNLFQIASKLNQFPKIKGPKYFSSKLTESYKITRNPNFKTVTNEDITQLTSIVGNSNLLLKSSDPNLYDEHNTDYMKQSKGSSAAILFPTNTDQISRILKYCNENKIAVVPQGGNTGLVIGSTPIFDEIIISTKKMNKIISFDRLSNILHCEAGLVLEEINRYFHKEGLSYTSPIDFGAKGSCQLGGVLSTNAGGIHFVKYGSLRTNCRGIKAVLPNGDIIDALNPLPKNNTGYDIKQIFIGSEGTIGIITECLMYCPTLPEYKVLALLGLNSFNDVVNLYKAAKEYFLEELYAIEFFDCESMEVQTKYNKMSSPIESPDYKFYIVLEIGSNYEASKERVEEFIEKYSDESNCLIQDGVVAADGNQQSEIWALREMILEGANKTGNSIIYDVSLPLDKFYDLVEKVRERGDKHGFKTLGFGHIGDYNIHITICSMGRVGLQDFKKEIEKFMFDYLEDVRGSVSAEHGIGSQKVKYLSKSQTCNNIQLMQSIKGSVDPNGIMNPYKIFL